MNNLISGLSVIATALFAYVVLTKLGVPVFLAILLSAAASFLVWKWESAKREDDESRLAAGLSAFIDLRDITKYLGKIF